MIVCLMSLARPYLGDTHLPRESWALLQHFMGTSTEQAFAGGSREKNSKQREKRAFDKQAESILDTY